LLAAGRFYDAWGGHLLFLASVRVALLGLPLALRLAASGREETAAAGSPRSLRDPDPSENAR